MFHKIYVCLYDGRKRNSNNLRSLNGGKIFYLLERVFSYRATTVRVQRNSSSKMRVWKQWNEEQRTTRKTGGGRQREKSARYDRHLRCMAVNDRTASSRQLAARWWQLRVGDRLMLASSICRPVCCIVKCVQGCLNTGSPSLQTIHGWVCNWLMSTEPG